MKRYPEYKDSGIEWIGKIPKNWKLIFLKYILKPGQNGIKIGPFGSSIKSNMLVNDGYKIYGQENIIKDNFEVGDRYITEQKFIELGVYELKENDVVITMMGTTGKSKVFPQKIKKGIMDSHLIRIRGQNVDSRYISILINDSNYIKVQLKISSKGSIMEGLNSTIVKSLLIALPSTKEQEVMTYILNYKTTQIDELINKKQRLIELLKEQRAAMINRAVTKGLNPNAPMKDSGIEWMGKIPEHWEIKKLKFLANIKYGLGQPPKSSNNGIPFIRATNIERGIINQNDMIYVDPNFIPYERDPILKTNDIIVVRSGAYTADSAIITNKYNGAVAGYDMVVRYYRVNPIFLSYALLSNYVLFGQLYLHRSRAAQPHLNVEELGSTLIIFPKDNYEQKLVADFILENVKKIDEILSKIEKKIALLREYRTALISEVVTGKIDVRDFVPDKTNSR
jgi:type I restriction enzyme S subunit